MTETFINKIIIPGKAGAAEDLKSQLPMELQDFTINAYTVCAEGDDLAMYNVHVSAIDKNVYEDSNPSDVRDQIQYEIEQQLPVLI